MLNIGIANGKDNPFFGVGIGLGIFGVAVTGLGILTILSKEESNELPYQIFDFSGNSNANLNTVFTINCDLKSNTAKGTLCTLIGMAIAYSGKSMIEKDLE